MNHRLPIEVSSQIPNDCSTCTYSRPGICQIKVVAFEWLPHLVAMQGQAEEWIALWQNPDGSTPGEAPPCPVWRPTDAQYHEAIRRRFSVAGQQQKLLP